MSDNKFALNWSPTPTVIQPLRILGYRPLPPTNRLLIKVSHSILRIGNSNATSTMLSFRAG